MPETVVRCTCNADWFRVCPVHGNDEPPPAPGLRQDRLGLVVPEGTLVTLPGEAMQQVVRDGPDGMLMLEPAGPFGEKGVSVVRRAMTRWLQRPDLRDAIMEVVKEDVKQRGPSGPVFKVEPYAGRPASMALAMDANGKVPWDPCDLVGFVKAFWPIRITPWQMRAIEEFDRMSVAHRENPPLIVRATPEQRRALLDCRPIRPDCRCEACGWEGDAKALALGDSLPRGGRECLCPACRSGDRLADLEYEEPEARDPQAEINARGSRVMEWLRAGETGWVPQRPEPSAVVGTTRTPPAQGLYRAPSRSLECTRCKWRGREFELTVHPRDPDLNSCPQCGMASWLQVDGKKYVPPALLAPAPVAACTTHVAAAAKKTPEIHCGNCSWEGCWDQVGYANPQDAESLQCPSCDEHLGPGGFCGEGPYPDEDGPTASPLDQAIRGSASLDPGGDRKPAEQLLVETFDQAEARRKVDAERIANMGRPL